jgi:hypothetical protein
LLNTTCFLLVQRVNCICKRNRIQHQQCCNFPCKVWASLESFRIPSCWLEWNCFKTLGYAFEIGHLPQFYHGLKGRQTTQELEIWHTSHGVPSNHAIHLASLTAHALDWSIWCVRLVFGMQQKSKNSNIRLWQ